VKLFKVLVILLLLFSIGCNNGSGIVAPPVDDNGGSNTMVQDHDVTPPWLNDAGFEIVVNGQYGYASAGKVGFHVFDLSGDKPLWIANLDADDDRFFMNHILIEGNYIYGASGYYGIIIADISDPCHPVQVGHFDSDPTSRTSFITMLGISSNRLYVRVAQEGIIIYSLDDPVNPVEIDFIENPKLDHINDNFAYALERDSLEIYNLNVSLINPISVVNFNLGNPHRFDGILIQDRHAYLWGRNSGLWIVDINVPENPVIVSSLQDARLKNLVIRDGTGFGIDYTHGFRVLDLSDPRNPSVISSTAGFKYAYGLTIDGEKVYIVDTERGISTLDVSIPDHPTTLSVLYSARNSQYIVREGNYLYTTSGYKDQYYSGRSPNQLAIIDIENPEMAYVVNTVEVDRRLHRFDVKNGYAYVTTGSDSITVFDVDPPDSAHVVSTIEIKTEEGADVSDIKIRDGLLYMLIENRLDIYNLADPLAPVIVNFLNLPYGCLRLELYNGFALITNLSGTLFVVDIDPVAFANIKQTISTGDGLINFDVNDEYIFLLSNDEKLSLVPNNLPAALAVESTVETTWLAWTVEVHNGLAFIGSRTTPGWNYSTPLYAINLNMPGPPRDAGSFESLHSVYDLNFDDRYMYAATGDGGIAIYRPWD